MNGAAAKWPTTKRFGMGFTRVTEHSMRSDRPARSAGRFRDASVLMGEAGRLSLRRRALGDEPLGRRQSRENYFCVTATLLRFYVFFFEQKTLVGTGSNCEFYLAVDHLAAARVIGVRS